ncbi:MAG: hypothetical protein R3F49_05525 [Planctomycetota bacterium]
MRTVTPSGPLVAGAATVCALIAAWALQPAQSETPTAKRRNETSASTALAPEVTTHVVRVQRTAVLLEDPVEASIANATEPAAAGTEPDEPSSDVQLDTVMTEQRQEAPGAGEQAQPQVEGARPKR